MKRKPLFLMTSAAMVLALAACSKGDKPRKAPAPVAETTAASAPAVVPVAPQPAAASVVATTAPAAPMALPDVHAAASAPVVAPAAPVVHEPAPQPQPAPEPAPVTSHAQVATSAAHTDTVCKATTDREVAALFDRWNASLQTGDKAIVAQNYAPNSILLPTVSDQVRYSRAEKEDYFAHFLENQPVGEIKERYIQVGCDTAIDAGLYEFTYRKTGARVMARYSFTYSWDGKQWLITSHHSSLMPERGNQPQPASPVVH